MRLIPLITIFSTALLLTSGCQSTSEWKQYTSEEGKYTISMPGKVARKEYVGIGDDNSRFKQKLALSGLGNSSYYIASTDVSKISPNKRESDQNIDLFLSKFIKSVAKTTGTNPDSIQEKSVTIDNFPCQKFESDFTIKRRQEKRIKGVFCLAENRLYTVFVVGEPELVEQNGERFLNSFKIEK